MQAWKRSYSARLPRFLSLTTSKTQQFLRDFVTFWTWQRQKRNNFARLPHFSKLTTSKTETKQFCKTSFKNGKLGAELTASHQCFLRFFHSTCQKYCACHVRGAAPVMQNNLPKTEDLMLQNATPLKKSAPGPPNSSDEHVSCTTPATENACLQILFKCPTMSVACHHFWKCYKTLTFCLLLTRSTIPCACHAKRHLNIQKWSVHAVLCTFWLWNVLRATTACTFSTSQLPKTVWSWCVLYILTSKCASRHNSVHFFDISTSKSVPKVWCF